MIDRNHPAVKMLSALESETMRAERAECAAAGLPASDHPAVQRAARVLDTASSKNATTNAHLSILTALEYLTADDLRATPAGQALMAEALEDEACRMDVVISNGDAAEQAAPAPGETGRGGAVTARDALYENPAQYLRERADAYRTETTHK